MGNEEREALLAAEEQALHVLSVANAEASRMANEAENDAVALLLDQQARAADLLHQAREVAAQDAGSAEDESVTLEAHRAAAELLGAAERDVAASLLATRADAAVDVLMAGHREAAAILLAAWMSVTEGRHSDR